jgi:ferrous iron transport protein B
VATEAWRDASPTCGAPRTLRLDNVLLHRVWGQPIFVFLMWGRVQSVFALGEPPMQGIESGLGWLSARLVAPGRRQRRRCCVRWWWTA